MPAIAITDCCVQLVDMRERWLCPQVLHLPPHLGVLATEPSARSHTARQRQVDSPQERKEATTQVTHFADSQLRVVCRLGHKSRRLGCFRDDGCADGSTTASEDPEPSLFVAVLVVKVFAGRTPSNKQCNQFRTLPGSMVVSTVPASTSVFREIAATRFAALWFVSSPAAVAAARASLPKDSPRP